MPSKNVLAKAIGIVSFLLAAFGGVFKRIAPPEEAGTHFSVGLASVLTLCLFLFISAITKNQERSKFKQRWLTAATVFFVGSIVASMTYFWNHDRLSFNFPEGSEAKYMAGTKMTEEYAEYMKTENIGSKSDLIKDVSLKDRNKVWKEPSIRRAKLILVSNYVVFVLSIAATIFCLTEGILVDYADGVSKRGSQKEL
ncbi:MAG: hypothetical protein GKS05_04210 [Nitrospirales bacterium]|nr:hypothetical protein [Nitrospirales bacterium]